MIDFLVGKDDIIILAEQQAGINMQIQSLSVLLLIIGGLAFIYNHFYVKPHKLRRQYIRKFNEKSIKVFQLPYELQSNPMQNTLMKDNKVGHAFKTLIEIFKAHDLVINNSFNKTELVLTSPKLLKEFSQNQYDYCYAKQKTLVENLKRVVGNGLVFAEGDLWKQKRKIISQVFNYEFIKKKIDEIAKTCDRAIEKNEEQSHKQGRYTSSRIYRSSIMNISGQYASKSMIECFLGGNSSSETIDGKSVASFLIKLKLDVNKQSTSKIGRLLGVRFLNLGLRSEDREINERIKKFNDWGIGFIDRIIDQINKKTHSKQPENLIEALIFYNRQNPQQYQFSSDDIFQQFKNFYLAGTTTVAHYIQMIMAYICQNPQALLRLQQQISIFFHDKCFSHENIKKMVYLDAVLKETIRMYGPTNFNFVRQVVKDHTINGIPIYAGTLIKYNSMGIHYSEEYYKQPYEFRPERWLNPQQCSKIDALKFIGFGIGGRSCIGKQLAIIEAKIAVITLLERYQDIRLINQEVRMIWKINYAPENLQFEFVSGSR